MGEELFRRIIKSRFWQPIQIAAAVITITLAIKPLLFGIELSASLRLALFIISVSIISFLLYTIYFVPKVPIYPVRFDFMENELLKFLKKGNSIKILNISFTFLSQVPKSKDIIKDKINEGAKFEVLLVRRKRKKDDTSCLKIRERDEFNPELISRFNSTLFNLFLFLLRDLYPLKGEEGERLFRNFQIKEYSFIPVMCMYIFDNKDLIFGPYISRKCDHIPLFHLKKRIYRKNILGAYTELENHYKILSDPNERRYKIYYEKFCYFDGRENKSIHDLIEEKHQELLDHLTPQKITEYEKYLIEEDNDTFHDDIIRRLGEKESDRFEGKFDAVMRDIVAHIRY